MAPARIFKNWNELRRNQCRRLPPSPAEPINLILNANTRLFVNLSVGSEELLRASTKLGNWTHDVGSVPALQPLPHPPRTSKEPAIG